MGFAHSVECWSNGTLIGGLYGISIGAAFFGESMFSHMPNASKIALVYLLAQLKLAQFRLLDTQFATDHLRQFGVIEIPSKEYLNRLESALKFQCNFQSNPHPSSIHSAIEAVLKESNNTNSQ
jgi:leucyl/phenylalanyl-tRNA--protein transferase